ncbi:hypothetical protein EMIHUDRAFT_202633 [Emiliania huxleyi CCMP1516]|uniref:Uncharacterized protein n=2 Tax=Emiliania huxleyi TaxID=2903 RepID=A0A0D3K8I3_EMIH1|nr:hypothetical protein EMIHUDRAFT_202633 [Emiliania huxleyi CCMP1516]EOD32068.1 hypothetical protein EMIHUDRAFT_202633 [Emiliania huxleyi CCMP1516]|eukprot:XP_005784497.1 hypothetical protein EMIHUDRAFT_202633 [Emiliania huxleyi CCMP1516]
MGYARGYDDELFQAWRDGEIRRKDLPEEVEAMALDLCERWRAEQERPNQAPTLAVFCVGL